MKQSLRLSVLREIVLTDFKLRFPRLSTFAVLLLTIGGTFFLIPDPSSGLTMIMIKGVRATYSPDTIALGSAMFCTILLTLFGYYIVSHTIRRDIQSGVGLLLASTPITNTEYLFGKFLGNFALLFSIMAAQMMGSIAMFFLRGEGTFALWPYLFHFGLIALPGLVFIAVIALLFESIKPLSGRGGDILYFFVWVFLLSLISQSMESENSWHRFIDSIGLIALQDIFQNQFGTKSFAVGAVEYKPGTPTVSYNGFSPEPMFLLSRFTSAILWIPLLGVALLFFHRFNPELIKSANKANSRNWFLSINQTLKPVSRALLPSFTLPFPFINGVLQEALLSLHQHPLVFVLGIGIWVGAFITSDLETTRHIFPIIAFFGAMPLLADLPIRDRQAGVLSLLYATPRTKELYLFRKIFAGQFILSAILLVPLARLFLFDFQLGFSLFCGIITIVLVSQSFGILSGNSKLFIVSFLLFIYIVENSPKEPSLDFSGFFGIADFSVPLYFALGSLLFFICSFGFFRMQQHRD
ncbi:MAG: hypothetical protein SFU91_13575 [Chloroherpetonaceae bacterium]|nr:hypothetical protein [Chloroherpetonaceae bacterium]